MTVDVSNIGTVEEEITRFLERARRAMGNEIRGGKTSKSEAGTLLINTLTTAVLAGLKTACDDDEYAIREGVRGVMLRLTAYVRGELR